MSRTLLVGLAFAGLTSPALAQTQTLPGKASEYTLNAAGTIAVHVSGAPHTIRSYVKFLFQEDYCTKGPGRFVCSYATGTPDIEAIRRAAYNEGVQAAMDAAAKVKR